MQIDHRVPIVFEEDDRVRCLQIQTEAAALRGQKQHVEGLA